MNNHTQTLGVYIHIPFCIRKCKYCDFLSFCGKEDLQRPYVEAVKQEIKAWGREYGVSGGNYQITTVYFGGGTPSSLPAIYIEEILQILRKYFEVQDNCEITLECNPGTVDAEKFISYYNMGINRLSIGLQTSHNSELKAIGRIHTYEEFLKSYQEARNAGFQNISIDVMSALPGQTLDSYHETLEKVIALKPEHISSYSLIIEEGTPFYDMWERGELVLPDEDTERQMYYDTDKYLREAGYSRYEISNYAREGMESRHNTSYWIRKNYLGIGLGASSMVNNIRFKNPDDMDVYLQRTMDRINKENIYRYYEDVEALTEKQQMEEYMFLGLRLMRGISVAAFEQEFGVACDSVYGEVCRRLEAQGLLCCANDRICLTGRGIDVSNTVLAEFL